MAELDEALAHARRLSAAFGMHPSIRNDEVIITEADMERSYWVSPIGEGRTMTPEEFATFKAAQTDTNWS